MALLDYSQFPFPDLLLYVSNRLDLISVNGHITLTTSVLVLSPKLSNVEQSQYLDRWRHGDTGFCWHSFNPSLRAVAHSLFYFRSHLSARCQDKADIGDAASLSGMSLAALSSYSEENDHLDRPDFREAVRLLAT